LCLVCCVVTGWLSIPASPHIARADYPSYPWTLELGPGNRDAEVQLEKHLKINSAYPRDANQPENAEKWKQGPDLSGRDFRRAEIHMGYSTVPLFHVKFDRSDFTAADIEETAFKNCVFRGAILRNIYSWGEIQSDCDLTDADITGSHLLITREQLRSTKNYKEKNLSGTILEGDFSSVSFAGFNLAGTVFKSCDLSGCDFTGADISHAAIGLQTEAEHPNSKRAFTKEQLYSTKSYKERNLDQVIFSNCDFRGADLSGQSLGHFVACDLTDANFSNAAFPFPLSSQYPYIHDSREKQSMYLGSRYGFTNCRLTAAQFYSTRTYKSAKLPLEFALEQMELDGWNFSSMDLTRVSFRDSSLKGANLMDARNGDFKFAKGLTLEQIKSTWNYKNGKTKDSVGDCPTFRLPEKLTDALQRENTQPKTGAKQ
jgi:uncharacterized protein YjbI with pentapeptide repeats